jgi:hypothetical protein
MNASAASIGLVLVGERVFLFSLGHSLAPCACPRQCLACGSADSIDDGSSRFFCADSPRDRASGATA